MSETMNMVEVFKNEEFGEVRTLIEGDKVLFCALDIASSLGYTNPRKAIGDHCRCVTKRYVPHPQSPDKQIEMSFIPESDVYRLIIRSKLPAAEEFERWVFDEVLPTIRIHGAYMTPETIEKALLTPDFLIKLAQRLKEEQEMRQKLEEKVEADKPLVEFANHVSNASNLIDIGTLAKIAKDEHIDVGRTRLFDWLRENGYLMSAPGNKNQPYQKYIEQGLFKVREYTYTTPYGDKVGTKTMVTGKGQMFFIEKLRSLFGTKAELVNEYN